MNEEHYMTIPVSEFESLNEQIRTKDEQLRELQEIAHQIVGYSRTVQAEGQPTLRKIAQNADIALSRSKGSE